MKLIIGLGNPGQTYQNTYHNLGFRVLDLLAQEFSWDFKDNKKFNAAVATGKLQNEKIILAKPQTYMNNSGQAVSKIKKFYRFKVDDVWVIYDDLNLPLGKIRVKSSGSAGGHQGVQSIIDCLRSENFYHFRIGIGPNNLPAEKFVLQQIPKVKMKKLVKAQDQMVTALIYCLENGVEKTMSQFN